MLDLLSADGGYSDDKGKVLRGNGSADAGAPGTLREGTVSVNGRLPPELIKRLIRHAFDRIRLCYATGLRSNPKLAGVVEIRFVIDQTGAVSLAQDHGSTMPDSGVTQCVVRILGSLSFPQPEGGGIVTVIYPVTLSPS